MKEFKIDIDQKLVLENGNWILHKKGVPDVDVPTSIFKYYALNEYNIDALRNSYFFLSNPKDFNDPFDCNYNLILEQQKEFITGFPSPSLNDVANKGICCFSTKGLDPLMWGHYTGSYYGFVVEYETNLEIVRTPKMIRQKLMKVIYSKDPKSVSENSPFANQYQLLIKLAHWQYENEWRLIVDKKDNSMNKIHFEDKSIKSISFGYQMMSAGKSDDQILSESLMQLIREKYADVPKFIVGPAAKELKLKKLPLIEQKAEDYDGFRIILK
ncbi:MAG: DUF2971 domain-containing protein [Crocinitomicaceae bacterium]